MLKRPLPLREFVELENNGNLNRTSSDVYIQFIDDRLHNTRISLLYDQSLLALICGRASSPRHQENH